jgi:glucosamine-6-phosphate deaminase
MDEYIGLDYGHPENDHYFMNKHLFDHIDIKRENINLLDGMAGDLQKECTSYEAKIKKHGPVKLFLSGIGVNGHLAFNEPGSSLSSRTRIKTLTQETRKTNARLFSGDIDKVPRGALTVGLGTIYDAEEVVLIASGESKAAALSQTIEGAIGHMCPASIMQAHPHGVIICDEAAASKLSPKPSGYFNFAICFLPSLMRTGITYAA